MIPPDTSFARNGGRPCRIDLTVPLVRCGLLGGSATSPDLVREGCGMRCRRLQERFLANIHLYHRHALLRGPELCVNRGAFRPRVAALSERCALHGSARTGGLLLGCLCASVRHDRKLLHLAHGSRSTAPVQCRVRFEPRKIHVLLPQRNRSFFVPSCRQAQPRRGQSSARRRVHLALQHRPVGADVVLPTARLVAAHRSRRWRLALLQEASLKAQITKR